MRVACFWIPHLPVQVERWADPGLEKGPLLIGGRRWDDDALLDCCRRAEAAGVEPGMRLSQAMALCPSAQLLLARADAYQATHTASIDAVRHIAPRVEGADLGLIYADISSLAPSHSKAPELALIRRIADEVRRACSLDVRAGAGAGTFVAERAARAARADAPCVVDAGDERAFLSPLPLSALPIGPEMARRLHLLGVRTLGEFTQLPRLAVVRQFGAHAGALHDMAHGQDIRPLQAEAPPLLISRSHTFTEPLSDRTPILSHLERMIDGMAEELDRRGYQAEGIRLELEEEHGSFHTTGKPVKPPSAEPDKLVRLSARLLGQLDLASAVASLTLTIYPLRPFHLGSTQLTLFDEAASEAGFSRALREALRRLRERFGEMVVTVAALIAPPKPKAIQVTTDADGTPRAMVWQDRIREVIEVYEIWRERRRWWSHPIERDYFRLELEDGQMRVVFRDLQAEQWFLERRHI